MKEHHFCTYREYFKQICILALLQQNESGLFPLQTKTELAVICSRTFMFGGSQAQFQTVIHDPLYLYAVFSLNLTLCHLHISIKHCRCHIESKDLQVYLSNNLVTPVKLLRRGMWCSGLTLPLVCPAPTSFLSHILIWH